jgi:hypothetical protein
MLHEPVHVSLLGALGDFPAQPHRFRFIAGLTRVIHGDDGLDLNFDHVPATLDQSLPFQSFAFDAHFNLDQKNEP